MSGSLRRSQYKHQCSDALTRLWQRKIEHKLLSRIKHLNNQQNTLKWNTTIEMLTLSEVMLYKSPAVWGRLYHRTAKPQKRFFYSNILRSRVPHTFWNSKREFRQLGHGLKGEREKLRSVNYLTSCKTHFDTYLKENWASMTFPTSLWHISMRNVEGCSCSSIGVWKQIPKFQGRTFVNDFSSRIFPQVPGAWKTQIDVAIVQFHR